MHPSGPLSCAHLVSATTRRAFSLVELGLVLAIMATMAAIAAPRYANAISRYRVDLAARRIVADLDSAQAQAKATSRTWGVRFRPGLNKYLLFDAPILDDATDITEVFLEQQPYGCRIISADFGGLERVVFDGYGVPGSGGSVIVESGGYQRTVILDADTGKGTVQ